MAGTNAGFNADDVRTALRSAMTMGAPSDTTQQVTFVFAEEDTYSVEDVESHPYDWTATPSTTVAARRVQVPCAVEYAAGGVTAEGAGEFDASRATLTLLDEDYTQVAGASLVLIGGVTYVIDAPGAIPLGLFDLTVYQLHVSARS